MYERKNLRLPCAGPMRAVGIDRIGSIQMWSKRDWLWLFACPGGGAILVWVFRLEHL